MQTLEIWRGMLVSCVALGLWAPAAQAQTAEIRIDEALQNITALVRADRVGYATISDGNKYIQCRRLPDRQLRCEAAGTTMQPSLKNVLLTGNRLSRLAALGWSPDPGFGNHVRTFPAEVPTAAAARQIVQTLTEAYAADVTGLEISTRWVADVPCPPRVGSSQNLAGSVNDSAAMRATAVHGCSYVNTELAQKVASLAELVALYGPTVAAEIQRLRINVNRRVWTVFDVGIGYVQCMPEPTPPTIYCEAQSSESWAALAAILTPKRIARLHSMGYADPGRSPNYWKNYLVDRFTDTAIASELLTILYDVYNYTGAIKLKVKTSG